MTMAATMDMGSTQARNGSTATRSTPPTSAVPNGRAWTSASTVLLVSCLAAAVIVLCSVASVALKAFAVVTRPSRIPSRGRAGRARA